MGSDTLTGMRVLMLDAPTGLLEERRRLGLDGRDEMWDGVLHVIPPPGGPHQALSSEFFLVVGPLAKRLGLVPLMETGLFRADDDYRVPDQLYRRPDQGSQRGAEGAEVVVEVRSSGDETYRKLPFFAAVGVREVIVLEPEKRHVELFRGVEGEMRPVSADADGALRSEVLGLQLHTSDGVLRLRWSDGTAEI